METSCRKYMFL